MACVGEFDGVSHQVKEDLLEPFLVAQDILRHIISYIHFELQALLIDLEAHDVADLLNGNTDFKYLFEDWELVIF